MLFLPKLELWQKHNKWQAIEMNRWKDILENELLQFWITNFKLESSAHKCTGNFSWSLTEGDSLVNGQDRILLKLRKSDWWTNQKMQSNLNWELSYTFCKWDSHFYLKLMEIFGLRWLLLCQIQKTPGTWSKSVLQRKSPCRKSAKEGI